MVQFMRGDNHPQKRVTDNILLINYSSKFEMPQCTYNYSH